MMQLRTIYKVAIDNGWAQKNPFAPIKIRFDEVPREFLTKEELARIMQKDFATYRMEHLRDVFVFCCFTGLSHCDALELTEENIRKDDDGALWLQTRRKKTDTAASFLTRSRALPSILTIPARSFNPNLNLYQILPSNNRKQIGMTLLSHPLKAIDN